MRRHPLFKPYLALVSVCFFWGTTYLAIRMALESFPPLILVSGRFLLSGSMLLVAAHLAGARLPRGRELVQTAINGVLILGVGNGCLVYSELWIPSGLAALIVTTSPFWMVGLDALLPGGDRLRIPTLAGIFVGALGAALLVAPGSLSASAAPHVLRGFLVLQLGCFSWSFGSILQRRVTAAAHPIVNGAIQQFAAGLAFLPAAVLVREQAVNWHFRGVAAILYLVVFGSIVGYSSYIYALAKLPVALVSIYTYVNPVVAVVLGAWLGAEPLTPRLLLAGLLIVGAVVLITVGERGSRR